jgi:lipopolysaccharide/colanic/teichoic acid biosynthesis glycosyltransferase
MSQFGRRANPKLGKVLDDDGNSLHLIPQNFHRPPARATASFPCPLGTPHDFNEMEEIFHRAFLIARAKFWQSDCEKNQRNEMPTKDQMTRASTSDRKTDSNPSSQPARGMEKMTASRSFSEDVFQAMLTLERRRAERSGQPFALMLLSAPSLNGSAGKLLQQALHVVAKNSRETDLVGWYQSGSVLGIIFTQITPEVASVEQILRTKISAALQSELGNETAKAIAISVHLFPENWNKADSTWVADTKLYSDLDRKVPHKRVSQALKRAMDVIGSATLLILLAPVIAVIAIVVKLTSDGPVLFEQERMGQFAARFKCLKFRTMFTNCDAKIHQAYVQQFIAGIVADQQGKPAEPTIYKITNDPRITPVGRFLRKTSLDELPQLWNVLRGEMSLVGPRPPVPYEFEIYEHWHRRRVFELKPGVTGLWQVNGRSRTKFDDMVRLDLRYSQTWSLWLDIKILLATPRAAFWGTGAY